MFQNFVGKLLAKFRRTTPDPADTSSSEIELERTKTANAETVENSSIDATNEVPWAYRHAKLLPGAPATIRVGKYYPFLLLGLFTPVIDFISDFASAGIICQISIFCTLFLLVSKRTFLAL